MKETLYFITQKALKPLVRILLRKGVSFREFSLLMRQLFVDVAINELENKGERSTTARVAIKTGLTRKDVAKLRQQNDESEPQKLSDYVDRGMRVINGWLNDPTFCNHKTLPPEGEISFKALVKKYSGDMPAKAVLKELKDSGLVETHDKNSITLIAAAYIPEEDEIAKLMLLGTDVELLLDTIEHNLQPKQTTPYFQRKVCYNRLPESAVLKFRASSAEDSMALLLKFNEWLRQQETENQTKMTTDQLYQAGVGIYYFDNLPTNPEASERHHKHKVNRRTNKANPRANKHD